MIFNIVVKFVIIFKFSRLSDITKKYLNNKCKCVITIHWYCMSPLLTINWSNFWPKLLEAVDAGKNHLAKICDANGSFIIRRYNEWHKEANAKQLTYYCS